MYCMYSLTPVNVLFDLPVDLPLNVKNVEEDSVPGQKGSKGQRGQTLRKIWFDVRSSCIYLLQ
jgi:hypothetical protein